MYELEEKDYYEALGLEQPEQAAGEEEQEAAEPAEGQEIEGANDQETAEPEEVDEPEAEPETKKEQSAEARRAQAAARRQREIEQAVNAAVAQERAAADARMTEFFRQAGLKNPLKDNADITSMEEYQEYQRAYKAQQVDAALKSGKPTRESIETIVQDMPQMQQLGTLLAQQEAATRQAQKAAMDAKIDHDIGELAKIAPQLNTREALAAYAASEEGREFTKLVAENNLTYAQAYFQTHGKEIMERLAAAERSRTEQNLRGKEHLKATKGQGKGLATVPADVMQQFRLFVPDATEAEIQAYYNKHHKE